MREHAEERIAEVTVDGGLEFAADLSDVQRAVPVGDGLEVWSDETFDVVDGALGQLLRLLDDEARPAVQRPPDPERDRERVAPLDRPVAGTQQAVPRPRPGARA